MTPEQRELYDRILAFGFDEGEPALPFAGRLSQRQRLDEGLRATCP